MIASLTCQKLANLELVCSISGRGHHYLFETPTSWGTTRFATAPLPREAEAAPSRGTMRELKSVADEFAHQAEPTGRV